LPTEIAELASSELFWLALGAFMIGVEKAGIKGLSMAVVPIYALILGGKTSSGLVLLLFISADLLAVRHYYRFGQVDIVRHLLWPAVIGVLIGVVLGNYIDDALFKDMIALIILACLVLMLFPSFSSKSSISGRRPFWAQLIGLITGFSTMIANVSSPILAIFLLALKLPKKEFIGTIVWFFCVINLLKLPFHIWVWDTVHGSTLVSALLAIPFIGLGFLAGLQIVGRIAEQSFRYLIVAVTLIAALKLLLA
jgi:hypothetical protein